MEAENSSRGHFIQNQKKSAALENVSGNKSLWREWSDPNLVKQQWTFTAKCSFYQVLRVKTRSTLRLGLLHRSYCHCAAILTPFFWRQWSPGDDLQCFWLNKRKPLLSPPSSEAACSFSLTSVCSCTGLRACLQDIYTRNKYRLERQRFSSRIPRRASASLTLTAFWRMSVWQTNIQNPNEIAAGLKSQFVRIISCLV